ncbi:hypothetical protein GCM10009751_30790 [Myceligenerans crystallogenes]|uniref:Uncharacterized protein n=1 Tax=Myceligenerans crystallogenes TaxID=316335 RepID=A0ABN2NIC3_9MICO
MEHRREDGELLGWIRPHDDAWVAISLLGREVSPPVEWLDAEEALEALGLAWLANAWVLERPDAPAVRVRLVDVRPGQVVVQTDDFGAIDVPVTRIALPWPAPPELRPATPDDAVVFGMS